jgi:hypothetical protein
MEMPYSNADSMAPVCSRGGAAGWRKTSNRRTIHGWMIAVWALGCVAVAASARAGNRCAGGSAFRPGERLTFVLKWTIIPAGKAVLEVLPRDKMAGCEANHFVLTARSNAFVDAFYKVRDRIDAWSDAGMHRSLLYRKQQHEGGTHRDITVAFNWAAMTARYSNQGTARKPISIAAGTFDPLSAFYFFRCLDLAVGERIQHSVTDGKQSQLGVVHVIRRETVSVPAGTFDAFLIEPDLAQVGGVFDKSPDAKIQVWVTADYRRLPVKLKSKVIVGSFTGELVSMKGTGSLTRSTRVKQ